MGLLDKCPSVLRSWTTPVQLTIVDLRLGLLSWALKIGVVIVFAVEIWVNSKDRLVEEPGGIPTFWFESAGLGAAQNGTADFCNNGDYDYRSSAGDSYWNNLNMGCARKDYGDIIKVGPTHGQVVTLMKTTHTKKKPCSGSQRACAQTGSVFGARVVHDEKISNGQGGFTCQCGKLHDQFVLGAEEMTLSLQHTFTTSSELDYVSGSTTYTKSDKRRKTVKTCVRNRNQDKTCLKGGLADEDFGKCCTKVVNTGDTITHSVREWLSLAGISLDQRLQGQVGKDKVDGKYPFYRVAGVKIAIMMKYYGDTSDNEVVCVIEVQHSDGFTEFGTDMTYLSYDPTGSSEYYDNYNRGILFTFYPRGAITTFSYTVLFNRIIAGLVFLAYVDKVVEFVAFYILPERSTYAKAKTEKLVFKYALAKFGINAALACSSFHQWDTHNTSGEKQTITKNELAKVYTQGGFSDEVANDLSQAVIDAVDGKNELECEDLVSLMSTELISLDSFRKRVPSPKGNPPTLSTSKVEPSESHDDSCKKAWSD